MSAPPSASLSASASASTSASTSTSTSENASSTATRPSTDTFSSDEWRIIGVTSIGHTLCHISELSFGAVIGSVMAEFGLQPDRAAAIAVPGFVLYGLLAVPAGIWTDRRGAREVLFAYFLLVALAASIVCFAASTWQLAVALTLLGAAISLYHPAGLTMISQGCRRRGRAMGINGVAGSLGVALGGALGLFFAGYGHWRWTYGFVGLLGLAAAASVRWLPTLERSAAGDTSSSTAAPATLRSVPWGMLGVLFLAMLFGGINYRALTTALPEYLRATQQTEQGAGQATGQATGQRTVQTELLAASGASQDRDGRVESNRGAADGGTNHQRGKAGMLVFVVLALGGIGQLAGGHLADRLRPSLVYVSAILVTIPLALMMAHGQGSIIVLAASVLAVFMFAQQPLENIMIAEATPAHLRSTVYGLKFILAFGLASSGAYLSGWVWDLYGLARVFDMFAIVACLMAAVALTFAWLRRDLVRSVA